MGNSAGDDSFALYKAKLQRAQQMALISSALYGLTCFLGFCALTWASAVVLGGLVTNLTRRHYFSVMALLLLEAIRLATTTFFGKLVTLKLVHGSADPHRLIYNQAPSQNILGPLRMLQQSVQLTVFTISILVPIRRLLDLKSLKTTVQSVDGFDGLRMSLRIFYVLVLMNGSIAALALLFSHQVVPIFLNTFSLRKYYEKIVWMGMDVGLLRAADFEFLSWTFRMQADEYRSGTRAFVVMNLYDDMMKFLYYYPNYKGFEAAKIALDSSDPFEREAAANIVGLWATLATEEKSQSKHVDGQSSDGKVASPSSIELKSSDEEGLDKNSVDAKGSDKAKRALCQLLMQTKLLAKLAEAIDNNESGRAATSSFWCLAKKDPTSVLMVRSEGKNEKIADILMDQIHMTVEMGRPNNALVYIKAMIPLLPYLIVSPEQYRYTVEMNVEVERNSGSRIELGMAKYCTLAKLPRFKEDMWTIVSEHASGLKRLQAVAAKAYSLFLSKDDKRIDELHGHLLVTPFRGREEHILTDEKDHLFEVLGVNELPKEWNDVIKDRPLERGPIDLPLLACRTTSVIASLVSVFIIVISSYFIIKYAKF